MRKSALAALAFLAALPTGLPGQEPPSRRGEADRVFVAEEFSPLGTGEQAPLIERLEIRGNQVFEDRTLREVFESRPTPFFRRNRLDLGTLRRDLGALERFYRQQGYRNASASARVDATPMGRAHITATVLEGPPTRIAGFSILGNEAFPDTRLRERITLAVGDRLVVPRIAEARRALFRLYVDNGYLDAKVRSEVRLTAAGDEALVDFSIDEGAQVVVDQVRIRGLDRLQRYVVARELTLEPGDILSYAELLETQRRLYEIDLFDSVFVSAEEDPGTTLRDVIVEVDERDSVEIQIEVGYHTVEQLGVTVGIRDRSVLGTAFQAGAAGWFNSVALGGETTFTEPRLFGSRWQTDLRLRGEQRQEPGYQENTFSGELSFSRRLGARSLLSLSAVQELQEVSDVEVDVEPQEGRESLESLSARFVWDRRDAQLDPRRGTLVELRNTLTQLGFQEPALFDRAEVDLRGYAPLAEATVVASGLSLGVIWPLNQVEAIPLPQRFYAGGAASVRGFGYREVGPVDADGDPVGGRALAVFNLFELRQRIWRWVGAALFADAGSVWATPRDIDWEEVRWGAGMGVYAVTPLGVFRLDYARNLFPRDKDEREYAVTFTIGHAF